MRRWRRAKQHRRSRSRRCTMCGESLLSHEPTIELRHRTVPGRLHFHEGEHCGVPAFAALVAGEVGAWTLIHHRVKAEAN